jgi:hypothetical protein
MFYQNKFDTKDLVHYVYYLIQAMLVFIMALHLTLDRHHHWNITRNMTAISLSAGISRYYAVVMYLQVMTMTMNYRQHIVSVAVAQFLSGTLFFLAPYVVTGEKFYWFWLTSIAIERVLVHIRIALSIPVKERAPPHFGHLSHRQVSPHRHALIFTFFRAPSSYSSLVKLLFNLCRVVVGMVCLILLVASWGLRSSSMWATSITSSRSLVGSSSVVHMPNLRPPYGPSCISSSPSPCSFSLLVLKWSTLNSVTTTMTTTTTPVAPTPAVVAATVITVIARGFSRMNSLCVCQLLWHSSSSSSFV